MSHLKVKVPRAPLKGPSLPHLESPGAFFGWEAQWGTSSSRAAIDVAFGGKADMTFAGIRFRGRY